MPHYVPWYFIPNNYKFFYYNNFGIFIPYDQNEKSETILSLNIIKSHFYCLKTTKTKDYSGS